MELKYCIFACFFVLASGSSASVEYVNTSRIHTPTPFIPSMMSFSVDYMLNNNAAELNRFEFYNSYVKYGRLFTVDKRALQEYEGQKEVCAATLGDKLNSQELAGCGRVVAALYVGSHNVLPQDFGFKHVIMEVVPKSKGGVFFFYIDGARVLIHRASDFDIQKNKRYEVEVNLSPRGDYDLRELGISFDYEAYLQSARLIKERTEGVTD